MGWRENMGAAPKIFSEIKTKEQNEQKEQKPDQQYPFATIAPIADRELNLKPRGIEQTDNCHGFKCNYLDSKAGESPICKKAMMPVFEVGLCPAGSFGPMTLVCESYEFKTRDMKTMTENTTRMYKGAKTWNPFKGCKFDCSYCKVSFQLQAKRQKQNCIDCYNYKPHIHEDRLNQIPNAEIVFVCGNGDISFCPPDFTLKIIDSIKKRNQKHPHQVYYFQSKRPEYFNQFLSQFPENVILVTTMETNRDEGYASISRSPAPTERYRQFKNLVYPRKVLTIEPMIDFDLETFTEWIIALALEYVWMGYNSRPYNVSYPEPSKEKIIQLMNDLNKAGIEIRLKTMRELILNEKKD
jgi:hypothetical protein